MRGKVDCVVPLLEPGERFGREIRAAWQSTIDGILKAGALLIQAKTELSHGQFERMVAQECPFSARTARQLMQIAAHPVLQDVSNRHGGAVLPNSVTTLRELARFEPDELSHALGNHWIKTDMKPEEAKKLHQRVRKALGKRIRKVAKKIGSRTDWLAKLRKAWSSATEDERQAFLSEIEEEFN